LHNAGAKNHNHEKANEHLAYGELVLTLRCLSDWNIPPLGNVLVELGVAVSDCTGSTRLLRQNNEGRGIIWVRNILGMISS
jgi:hypothetical protein